MDTIREFRLYLSDITAINFRKIDFSAHTDGLCPLCVAKRGQRLDNILGIIPFFRHHYRITHRRKVFDALRTGKQIRGSNRHADKFEVRRYICDLEGHGARGQHAPNTPSVVYNIIGM